MNTGPGYLHYAYASSLSDIGRPRLLSASEAWILERRIRNSEFRDGMGCYPLFCCRDWAGLDHDFGHLQHDLIALSVVTDPFGEQDVERLKVLFPDLVTPFKNHSIVDLQCPLELDAHHRRNERKALANVVVECVNDPATIAEDWVRLYSVLMMRHQIRGLSAFSPEALKAQLSVPGAVAFRALRDEITVGMTVWYVQGSVAYYHLGAYTEAGYNLRASYAVFSIAIRHFRENGLRWLDLGGVAGFRERPSDGLARFKQGWSTGTRIAYLCGRIWNHQVYEGLTAGLGKTDSVYFPAYRDGEFA